jgi:hypothetical protein
MPVSRRYPLLLALLAVIVVGVVLAVMLTRPTWTVERVQDVVVTTLQQETPASELVTGRIGVTASREIRDRGRFSWIPEWIGLPGVNLVSADVQVEVVGEALYGFDVQQLRREMITIDDAGVIEIDVPALYVVAVEPDLSRLQIRTREGILRAGASRTLQAEALGDVQDALREQGQRHVETSDQPAINTGRALAETLRPAFEAAGMPDPQFRFRIRGDLVLEPQPRLPAGEGPELLPTPQP